MGHQLTFSETLADVAPEEWGGETSLAALSASPRGAGPPTAGEHPGR